MYFQQFPKIPYSFDVSNIGTFSAVTNILARFNFNQSSLNNTFAFYKYQYVDGDTPELVSFKEYGDPQYHWVVSMVNQINDPQFEFPLQRDALEQKIIKQYGFSSIAEAYSTIHHYELEITKVLSEVEGPTTTTVENFVITLEQYNYATNSLENENLATTTTRVYNFYANNSNTSTMNTATLTVTDKYKEVFVYDYEDQLNEQRRQIKLLKPQYIPSLMLELETVLND
jgi:hypothetical protein